MNHAESLCVTAVGVTPLFTGGKEKKKNTKKFLATPFQIKQEQGQKEKLCDPQIVCCYSGQGSLGIFCPRAQILF